ncbi:hypothetical protein FHY52_04355 [Nocardia nova]|uniref:hypothetical protein n=1 Tax=Nocardia nova TaxID=37330 RepID=UPI0025B13C22|nr:hypothetical protein [Nocardia nova]MDN2495931.1 hypothetical protein [Nocardia nova]
MSEGGDAPDPEVDEIGAAQEDILAEVMRRRPTPELAPPPTPTPTTLPFGIMDPLVFERLVAEVAQSVFRLDDVQAYGRHGQYQAGLDIVGWKSDKQIVYQIRRIDELKPESLESAVRDYANPTRRVKGKVTAIDRPFPNARQFVLVTGCMNSDTAVTDKLNELKDEFENDFDIHLIDARSLSSTLRLSGPIVAGYFGPHWAKEFCDYSPPPRPGIGDGAGLLEDPVTVIGERENYDQANALKADSPRRAAEIYERISRKLAERSLPFAEMVEHQAIEAFESAGDIEEAFRRIVSIAVTDIESCSWAGESVGHAYRLAKLLESAEALQLVELLTYCRHWFEHGFNVTEAVERLRSLATKNFSQTTRVALIIAEMVITDEDDRDDHSSLLRVVDDLPTTLSGIEEIRLRCARADLAIMAGQAPRDAYEGLLDDSYSDDGVRALIERRFGRALANVDETSRAINAYRRSVMHSWHAGLGGDVRDALRSVAALSRVNPFPWQNPMATRAIASARSIRNREHLIMGKRDATVNALENISDSDAPDAVRWSHHWLRLERISGGDYDEGYARRNYARALEQATLTDLAVKQYINLGSRKLVAQAASKLSAFMDVSGYLSSPSTLRRACAADVIAKTSDLVPDFEVQRLSELLTDVFLQATDPLKAVDSDDSIASLGALASFDFRLPVEAAARIIGRVAELIPRAANQYRFIDDQLLEFLTVVALEHESLRHQATFLLLEMLRLDVGHAEHYVGYLKDIAGVKEALDDMVSTIGSRPAASVLASWQVATEASSGRAVEMVAKLMEEPLDVPKNAFVGGRPCCEASAALSAAFGMAPRGSDIANLRQPWLEHLQRRMNNRYMSAEERADAAAALRFFVKGMGSAERDIIFHLSIALFDDPKIGRMDAASRANYSHPMARFKLSDGGSSFEADLLNTAAHAASTEEQRAVAATRLRGAIRTGSHNERVSNLLAKAAIHLGMEELQAELAASTEASLREAACVLWARSPSPDTSLGEHLSQDPETDVRLTFAHELASTPSNEARTRILDVLAVDPSAQVRRAIKRALAEG